MSGEAEWPVDELLTAAGRAVPGRAAVLLADTDLGIGVVDTESELPGIRAIHLAAGHPGAADPIRSQIARIAAGLSASGWDIDGPDSGGEHVRLVARRNRGSLAAEVVVHGWQGRWQIELHASVEQLPDEN